MPSPGQEIPADAGGAEAAAAASTPTPAAPAVAAPVDAPAAAPAAAAPPSGDNHTPPTESPSRTGEQEEPTEGRTSTKKFSSLNVNQRFLQNAKAATSAQTAPKQAPTAPASTVASRLSTKPPTVRPAPRTESPSGTWSRSAEAGEARESAGPAWSQPRAAAPAPAPERAAPPENGRAPWVRPSLRTNARPGALTSDFPTAAEALEAKRKEEERIAAQTAAHAAEESARHKAALEELDKFRGTTLNSTSHWDEDELDDDDDVVDFGDGKQYKLPHESPAPKPAPATNAWTARAPREAAPAPAPAPAPVPRATWGPMAQRHAAATGEPRAPAAPAAAAPARAVPAPAPAVPKDTRTAEEIAAEQQSEMVTAAERARKRREEDERVRTAERERAQQRAQQIEEQIKAEKRAKDEARHAEKRAARERAEAERARREAEAQARLAREDAARERAQKAADERREARAAAQRAADETERLRTEATAKAQEEAPEGGWRRSERDKHAAPRASPAARRTDDTHVPSPVPSSAAPPLLVARPGPSPFTRPELAPETPPVWRKFRIHIRRARPVRRRASEAAVHGRAPYDGALHAQTWVAADGPFLPSVETAAADLFPAAPPRVRMGTSAETPAASVPSAPVDETLEAWAAAVRRRHEAVWDDALFPSSTSSARDTQAVHVRLPRTARRTPPGGAYGGLFDAAPPYVSLPDASGTWGAGAFGMPMPEQRVDAVQQRLMQSMWSSTMATAAPKNSLRGLDDDLVPAALAMQDTALPGHPNHKLDALASPFQPSGPPPRAAHTPGVRAGAAARDPGHALHEDYSEFVLSGAW